MSNTQITLEFLANTDGLKAAAQQMQLLGKLSKEQYDQFTKAGAEYQKQLKENAKLQQAWGETITENANQATLLNDQFRAMADAIAKGAIEQAAERFTRLAAEAANAAQNVNDTGRQLEYLDTDGSFASLLDSARDVVSVLSLAKNTTALFGNENKELANTIAKASEAINLVSDAQKVANNLIKEGGVLTKAYNFTLAIAESLQTQFAISSTAAWAAATGGITLVVGAIGAMVYAITEATGQSVEGIKMLTKELDKAYESYNARTENIQLETTATQLGYEKEMILLKQKGATISEIQDVENKAAAETKRALEDQKNALVNNSAPLQMLLTQYTALFDIYDNSKSANRPKEETEALKAQLDAVGKLIDEHRKLDQALAEFEKNELTRKNQQRIDLMNNALAVFEQQVLLNRKYSEEEKKTQLAILEQQRDIKLQSLTTTNEQAKLINLQFNRDKLLLEQQYDIAALNQAKQTIDTKLAAQRQGTRQEFELRIQAIQAAADIEKRAVTENTIYTQQQRANIQAKANADIQKLSREFNFAMAQSQIEADQAYQQTRIINAKANSKQLLDAELALIDAQADAKRLAIDKDVVNETEHKNKLLLLLAETQSARLALQNQYYDSLQTMRETELDAEKKHLLAKVQIELGGTASRFNSDASFQLKIKQYDIEDNRLKQQLQLLENTYESKVNVIDNLLQKEEQGTEAYAALLNKRAELDKKYMADRLAIIDTISINQTDKDNAVFEHYETRAKQVFEAVQQAQAMMLNEMFEANMASIQQGLNAEMERLNHLREQELSNENLTQQQKDAINTRYRKMEAEAKRKAWRAEQAAKAEQAIINGMLGFTASIATQGVPAGLITGAIALALAGVQAGLIYAKPVPEFAKGGKNIPAGMKLVGEQGPELIWTPGGETVIPHGDTAKILEAWSIPVPNVNPALKADMAIAAALPAGIDYNKLAQAFAQELRNNPSVNINMDSNGFALHLIEKNKNVQLLNNRYSA